ncbi:MAG: hypothetical protein NT121_20230 [Chloroflexi bacterium]|nr:hypothetical protein [Chloroflexota bacterium]
MAVIAKYAGKVVRVLKVDPAREAVEIASIDDVFWPIYTHGGWATTRHITVGIRFLTEVRKEPHETQS